MTRKPPIERFNNWIESHTDDIERLILKAKTELSWTREQFWNMIHEMRLYARRDQGIKKWATRKAWGRTIDNWMFRSQKRMYGSNRKRVSDISGPSGKVKLS